MEMMSIPKYSCEKNTMKFMSIYRLLHKCGLKPNQKYHKPKKRLVNIASKEETSVQTGKVISNIPG